MNTNNTTLENNKLIAEFMGNTVIEQNGEFYCKLAHYQLRKIPPFDTDWNRLMEVCNKLTTLTEWEDYPNQSQFWDTFCGLDIDDTYLEAVDFIKFYNSAQKEN